MPAPQGPPPAVVPIAPIPGAHDGPMREPTPPTMDEPQAPQTADDGQWSRWAHKTGGGGGGWATKTGGWHPTKTWGPRPTGGWGTGRPHHGRPHHPRPTGTRPHVPTKPAPEIEDDEDMMSILPVEPMATFDRRGLDINYHLAPRGGEDDEEDKQKAEEKERKKQEKEQEKAQKKAEKLEEEKQKEIEKQKKKYTSVVEEAPTGTATPTAPVGGGSAHSSGMPQPTGGWGTATGGWGTGRPQGTGVAQPTGAWGTGVAQPTGAWGTGTVPRPTGMPQQPHQPSEPTMENPDSPDSPDSPDAELPIEETQPGQTPTETDREGDF